MFNNYTCSQNLITNPSFELIDSCYGDPAPIGFDVFQWSGCLGWSNPTYASSDLWCQNPVFGNNIPPLLSGVGYQYPRTGDNMVGFITVDVLDWNYREYIQNRFTNKLIKDKYYTFSLYVNTVDTTYNYSSCLQAYFSENPISQHLSYDFLPLIPQFSNDNLNYIVDTLGWQKITGYYKSVGNEQYVIIGCFNDSASITVKDTGVFNTGGIYSFIDDITLEVAPFDILIPNVFTPNQDGANDIYQPLIINIDHWEMKIFNRWGNLVTKLNNNTPYWDGKNASEGTYFYIFYTKDYDITETGTISLFNNQN